MQNKTTNADPKQGLGALFQGLAHAHALNNMRNNGTCAFAQDAPLRPLV